MRRPERLPIRRPVSYPEGRRAPVFDGSSEYAVVPYWEPDGTAWALELEVKPDSPGADSIFVSFSDPDDTDVQFSLGTGAAGTTLQLLAVAADGTTLEDTSTASAVVDGEWQKYRLEFSDATDYTITRNGVQVMTGTLSAGWDWDESVRLTLAARIHTSTDGYFTGSMCNVRLIDLSGSTDNNRLYLMSEGVGTLLHTEQGVTFDTYPPVLEDGFDEEVIRLFGDKFGRDEPTPWYSPFPALYNVSTFSGQLACMGMSGGPQATLSLLDYDFTEGTWYRILAGRLGPSTSVISILNDALSSQTQSDAVASGVPHDFTFRANGTSTILALRDNSLGDGQTGLWNNVVIQEVPALAGWNAGTSNSLTSIDSDMLRVENGTAAQAYAYRTFTTVSTEHYVVSWVNTFDPANATLAAGTAQGLTDLNSAVNGNTFSFTATGTTTYIGLFVNSTGAGDATLGDNITVRRNLVENGTFDTDLTGWTVISSSAVWDSGTCLITGKDAGETIQNLGTTTVVGQVYVYDFEVTEKSGAESWIAHVLAGGALLSTSDPFMTAGKGSVTFMATATNCRITFKGPSPSTINVDNITLRPLHGQHAVLTLDTTWAEV